MLFRRSSSERRRCERLKALPPLAIEFSRLMSEVFGERSKDLAPEELGARRARAASIARLILADIEELRWDQDISAEMRSLLERTQANMIADHRIRGLLRAEKGAPATG